MAHFGERVAGLPEILQTLYYHPEGMRFSDLAGEVGRREPEVRETLRTYHLADLADLADSVPDLVARPEVVEFFDADGPNGPDAPDELPGPTDGGDDAATATHVRLLAADPGRELGVARVSLADLARLYRVATDALVLDPDDAILASALGKLREGLLPGLRITGAAPDAELALLQRAVREHRRVAITYARVWAPAIEEALVEPHLLLRTHRGWEVDTTPGDELSPLRTYLVGNIRRLRVTAETFDPPPGLAGMLHRHRTERVVVLDVPPYARWAVDKQAERVELVEDGVDLVRLRVCVLQPYALRIGQMLVAGGPSARVVEPTDLAEAGREVARDLLSRYEA